MLDYHVELDEDESVVNVFDCESTPVKIKEKRIKDTIRQMRYRKHQKMNDELIDVSKIERRNILDKLLLADDDNEKYNQVYISSVAKYFRRMIKSKRYVGTNQQRVAVEILKSMFGSHLAEASFCKWLAMKLEVEEMEFTSFLQISDKEVVVDRGGRSFLSKELRLDVYEYWIANSEVSVQRSNNRHLIKVSMYNVREQIADIISDTNIEKVQTKRGEKLQANRCVTNKTYEQIYRNWKDERNMNISIGSFLNLKPFYVTTATVKEMEMCLCGKCLNPHNIYKAIKSAINEELPKSLSEYVSKELTCSKDTFNKFHKLDCITGKCNKSCKLLDIKSDLKGNLMRKEVSYYIFEKVLTHYFSSVGEKVHYARTTRVNKKDSLGYLITLLQDSVESYLTHRWYVINDEVFWKKFAASCPYYILWMDYSQNIAFKEKKQVQSAHYSGLQHTLHDTVLIHPCNKDKHFLYHISDDTNHDAVLTFSVINDIIKRFPQVIAQGVLVIRSDNCEDQYKCRYVFEKMIALAKSMKVFIAWIYGIDGHGKGIVDAMSSFGVKQPMKKAILNEDEWFTNAKEMCS